jgi:N4-(beta-N-acetylglucosaminyl)-L-asparaginase|tara:strand:+ start:1637 stop:2617 length:981 start_codon:yes stop_codon:yes gene_type:complete
MSNRRDFIKKTSIGALGTIVSSSASSTNFNKENKNSMSSTPIVISTWKHGFTANEKAYKLIKKGSNSIDAVEAGVMVTEADPKCTSVGLGGWPDRDGNVTLDACIMDHTGNCGSVSFLQNIKHPISVARQVMDNTPHVMLSGEGALQFALKNGFHKEDLLTDKARLKWKEWLKDSKYKPIINVENHDTIGLLAIDQKGNISGACTTSGLAWKMHGRVGDSPIIGAGMFVDNEIGGCCATGVGEAVMKTLGSFLIVELMRQGASPQEACEEGIARIVKNQNYNDMQIGYLAINKKGDHGAYAVHAGFDYALYQNGVNKMIDAVSFVK